MSAIKSLLQITAGADIFLSPVISHKCTRKYNSGLIEACRIAKDSGTPALFDKLAVADKVFFLRMPGVRASIDMLITGECSDNANVLFRQWTVNPLHSFSATNTNLTSPRRWAAVGGDMGSPISDSYPFYMTAWKDTKNYKTAFCEHVVLECLFRTHMENSVGKERCCLRECDSVILDRIDRCLNYLNDISSELLHDIVINVRAISMIDYARWESMNDNEYREIGQSVSTHLVPSSSFFSDYSLRDDERCLESIYHEALHKKLSNTLIAFDLIRSDYQSQLAPKFFSFWNADTAWNSNKWEFDRALYALHIYVHLYVLYRHVLEMQETLVSHEFASERAITCGKRASALLRWVTDQKGILTDAGVWMVDQWRRALENAGLENQDGITNIGASPAYRVS